MAMSSYQYNVGGSESFTPLCAFDDGYNLETVTTKDKKGTEFKIEMAVFKMDIVFATNKTWADSLDDESPEERSLIRGKAGKNDEQGDQDDKCEQGEQQTCCAALGVVDKKKNDDKRDACEKVGCKISYCSPKKKKEGMLQIDRSSIGDDWTSIDFNEALDQYTVLEPVTSGAVVDATKLSDLSKCRANSYNWEVRNYTTLSQSEYEVAKCDDNDYYDPEKTKIKESWSRAVQECCSADAWNGLSKEEKEAKKAYCKSQGVECPKKILR
ncbi:hypothetical protein ACHAWO_003363 [Cyclotella atomus]|jgi:hypothetical protein|uniref:Uncharacterized protein n=1 Tax=Cyclotella atomus TaxID=382360 RepID=A0ABD3NCE2_9STRA